LEAETKLKLTKYIH